MKRLKVTCILCPVGCRLTVVKKRGGWRVKGYGCMRGVVYGVEEAERPTRTLITVIPVENGELPVVPVKTSEPIPKGSLIEASKAIAKIKVKAPVRLGQIVLKSLLNFKVNVVATRSVNSKQQLGGKKGK